MEYNLDEISYMMLSINVIISNMLAHRIEVDRLELHELADDNHVLFVDIDRHDRVQMLI